ncbi:excitatory amino acid transporter 1-like [Ruditapes philippinarum]|uniref:excitatory amino acid transporter 1-like n=1 Tax=Ruditapes philippinarum TaxID=129788 RepID=UPI00295A770B|nr:excitatory amino acid transporter 1-like [Ruditapes philippinarum]
MDELENKTCRQKCYWWLKQNLLVILTLVACGVGFLIGLLVEPADPSPSAIMWIGMPGELYIRMLKMTIVPLVVCSVIAGTAKMDPRTNGKVSGSSMAFIMLTNFLTPLIAAALSYIIKPGEGVETDVDPDKEIENVMQTEDIFADLLRNIVPDNLIASCFQQAQTKYDYKEKTVVTSNGTHNSTETVKELKRKYVGSAGSTNVLGLIIVSVVFGVGGAAMKEDGKPFLNFFKSATDIILKVLRVLIWSTPIGVASLIAKTILTTKDVEETFRKLGMYALTVEVGLVFWGFIVIPLVFLVVRRANPFRFYGTIIPSIMIVIVTASTMIALPESFHSLETKNNCDPRISRLVAPLSATIGRAGSVLYITCSCFFIIQTLGRDVNAADIILVVLLAWISALAIPSVAGASLVTVLILLTALNIPGEAAAMLFALEFFLDRSRSVVNLLTQLTGVMVVDKFCAASLPKLTPDSSEKEKLAYPNIGTMEANVNHGFEKDTKDFQFYDIGTRM